MNLASAALRTLRFGNFRWRLRADVEVEKLRPLLENPEAFLSDPARYIKNSRVVTIARVPEHLILRRLNYGKFVHRIRDFLRQSRVQRALERAQFLEAARVNTPRALAACEVRLLRWPRMAYLITDEVRGAVTLAGLFHAEGFIPTDLIQKLASLIARLHNHGLSHRDLKWTNILFDQNREPWLIDLDGVREFDRLPDEQAGLDLLSLLRCFGALSPTGSEILKRYCEERRPPADFQAWSRDFEKRLSPP